MKKFKVCLHLGKEILKTVQLLIEEDFTVVEDPAQCHVFLTDVHTLRNQNAINMLIVDSHKLPKFKGVRDLEGFHHYIIFNERGFLEERIKKVLFRHWAFSKGKDPATYTGVSSLLSLEKSTTKKGFKLPLIKHFRVTSSCDRKLMAEGLEKFFAEIDRVTGLNNPVITQNTIEIQEELLMNAIWDANPKYANQPRSIPIELDPCEEVDLQWAFNGKEMAISVRDPFGRMDPAIMEKYINFIFKTGQSPEHNFSKQTCSAGLGIYMIIQRANVLSVFISNGRITDVGIVMMIKSGKRSNSLTSKAIDIIHV